MSQILSRTILLFENKTKHFLDRKHSAGILFVQEQEELVGDLADQSMIPVSHTEFPKFLISQTALRLEAAFKVYLHR